MKTKKPYSVNKLSSNKGPNHKYNKRSKGYSSVSKSTLAPKHKELFDIPKEEYPTINVRTLDFMILKLWAKFIVFYRYEDVFKIPSQFKKDETVMNMKKNIAEDFELKLKTYFEIYKIKKDENLNLISMNEEGSYLLFHSQIWIMHMKVLLDKYNYKLKELYSLFNRAIENECDIPLLFDFFISVLIESDCLKEEIDGFDDKADGKNGIPKEIYDQFVKHKDHVMQIIHSDEMKKMRAMEDKKEHYDVKDDEEEENYKINIDSLSKDVHTNNDDTSHSNNSNDRDSYSGNDSDDTKKIIEVSKEQEDDNDEDNDDNAKETERENNIKAESNFKPISKQDTKNNLTPQPSQYKKKEYHRAFNIETDLMEATVIEENIRSSGNYAIFELNPKIQESLGQKYVLTPIKSTINKREASDDRQFINTKYQDYIYQPYTEAVLSLIKSSTKISHDKTPRTPNHTQH